MTDGTLEIEQYSDNLDYCRLWDASATAFVDLDDEAVAIAGAAFALWGQPADILFIGKDTTFNSFGHKIGTAGVGLGTFSYKYSITSTDYPIASTTLNHTLTVAADVHLKFKDGYTFTITGSSGGLIDGVYTCDGDSTYSDPNTTITVVETLAADTDDGTIAAHSIWAPLTVRYDRTLEYTQSGWVLFDIESDWGLSTVDGDEAYWINIRQDDTPYPVPTAYHLKRHLTLAAPLHAEGPKFEQERFFQDINGYWNKKDITYKGPNKYTINATAVSFGSDMDYVSLLCSWELYQTKLYIVQELNTPGILYPQYDPYYRYFRGFLVNIPDVFKTPGKMGLAPGAYYPLEFVIDNIATMDSLTGRTL